MDAVLEKFPAQGDRDRIWQLYRNRLEPVSVFTPKPEVERAMGIEPRLKLGKLGYYHYTTPAIGPFSYSGRQESIPEKRLSVLIQQGAHVFEHGFKTRGLSKVQHVVVEP